MQYPGQKTPKRLCTVCGKEVILSAMTYLYGPMHTVCIRRAIKTAAKQQGGKGI